ncbi:hypothetical protein OG978_01225 [Streptomyces sp. NBC_01591]|uniref:hypothetical protein n=1 Tax=Streptomyces sp. NBC_01591 TaxID=2975888 RepID=UPI002DD82EF7|nr:hypothetical protein [Streptomyces sp. NBC_01591]WSD66181.1 hypothetical protein OG978_01225 [Streptomyces sp. NBC_01591]
MAFLALLLDTRDYDGLSDLLREAVIRRQRREDPGLWSLDLLAQEHEVPVAEVREALAQGDHPILDRTTPGCLLGRFAGISAWVDDHVKGGTTRKMVDMSLAPGFFWPPLAVTDWAQRLKRDMKRLRPDQEAAARAALRSVHALMDGADMCNQLLRKEEPSRAVHAHAVQRGVLDRAGSAETVRASDRAVALATRTREALLRTTGWEAEALARLTVRDVVLLDDGQTVELYGRAPDSPARQHVGWRTGALVAALAADRAEDELLLDYASDPVAP